MRISAGTMQTVTNANLAASFALTVPSGAKSCDITVEGQSIRYTDDGVTTPTASVGMLVNAGTTLENYTGPLSQLRLIRVASGAAATVSFYKASGPYQLP